MDSRVRGFTYVEFLIAVVVVAIITIAAMPDSDEDDMQEATMAADQFKADISYASSASVARPDDPMVLKVDVEGNRYWLARKSDPTTPISHPRSGEPYVVQFGVGNTNGLSRVSLLAKDFGGDAMITFDGTGMLNESVPPVLQLASGRSGFLEICVMPSSGACRLKAGLIQDLGVSEMEYQTIIDEGLGVVGDVGGAIVEALGETIGGKSGKTEIGELGL